MSTIQLAINDPAYARWIRSLLLRDGAHQVHVTDWPKLKLDGVIVIDRKKFETLSVARKELRRFIVIAPNDNAFLSQICEAGVRHVVFEGDPPATAALAILALEPIRYLAQRRLPNYALPAMPRVEDSVPPRAGNLRRSDGVSESRE